MFDQSSHRRAEVVTFPNELRHPESYYARHVVVPVANPQTAPQLIQFAASLAHPEKGRVTAAYINQPDSPYEDAREQLTVVVKRAKDNGIPVEFVSITSNDVARGVLDITRESNADLLVLGYQTPKGDKVVLGPVVENIARVVPGDLVIYRHVSDTELERIVVPVTSLEGTRVAMIHALHLAERTNAPIVALFVRGAEVVSHDDGRPFWLQRAQIYDMIYSLPGGERAQTKVVHGDDLSEAVRDFSTENDLIVLSVEQSKSALDRWLFGATSQKMLRLAPGSLELVRRGAHELTTMQRVMNQIVRWTPRLTITERTDVIEQAGDLTRANTNFIVMIILSGFLASIGLLQNSAAVIIGAMLVAPLMSPLMGFGVGLAIGQLDMMRRSALTVAHGVLMVILVSVLLGVVFPLPSPTTEMLARGRPNLLDMGVALASGAAGAFAMARRDIPAALAGVAIAAALVPPLCTTGLALGLGNGSLILGAGTLSIVNIICISIAAAGVFAIMGIHQAGKVPLRQRLAVSLSILLAMTVVLSFLLFNDYQYLNAQHHTTEVLEKQLVDARVLEVEVDGCTLRDRLRGCDDLEILVTLRTPHEVTIAQIREAERELENELKRDVLLDVIIMRVIHVD